MKIFVDEMPLDKYSCPFSKEYESRIQDARTKRCYWAMEYDCSITKETCDLKCGACSGLRVLKIGDNHD